MLSRHTKALDQAAQRAEDAVSKSEWREQKGHIYDKIDQMSERLNTLHARVEENSITIKWHEQRLGKINGFSQ